MQSETKETTETFEKSYIKTVKGGGTPKACCRCHKMLSINNYLRKNYKATGEIREWKVCNSCILKKLNKKILSITKDFNIAYNYITPYNE